MGKRSHLSSGHWCWAVMLVSALPLQDNGCQGNSGAKTLHSHTFPLIIANVNKCWLALYTCLACKSTLIGCAKIEEKVICPFKTTDREMKCCLGLYCYNFADKIVFSGCIACLCWQNPSVYFLGVVYQVRRNWYNLWSSLVEIHLFFLVQW